MTLSNSDSNYNREHSERQALATILKQSKPEFPNLNYSIADIADVEQMACLLHGILNLYFGIIKLPDKFVRPIFALIGASAGCQKDEQGWFYLRDRELAIYMMSDEGRTPGAMKQRIKRFRHELEQWQTEKKIRLVTIDRGYAEYVRDKDGEVITNSLGDKDTNYIPTRYKINVLDTSLKILQTHQMNPGSGYTKLKQMAKELKLKLQGWYSGPDSAGRKDPAKMRNRAMSFARSNIKKIIEYAREDDDDPVVFIMSLIKDVEQYIGPDDRVDQWLRGKVVEPDERIPDESDRTLINK